MDSLLLSMRNLFGTLFLKTPITFDVDILMIQLEDSNGKPLNDNELKAKFKALQKERRMLVIRNWLNSVFIVLALVAIVGVLIFKGGERGLYISYAIAVLAIIIKMVEALFRMPGFKNR